MEDFLISAGTKLGISAIKAFGGGGGSAAGAALGAIAGAFDEDGGDFGGDDIGGDSVDFGGGGEDIDTGGFDNDAGGGDEYTEDYTGEEYYDESTDTTALDGGYYEEDPTTYGAYDESGYEEGYNDDGTYTDEYGVTYDENGYVVDDGSGYDRSAEGGGFDQTISPSGEAASYGDGYTYEEQEGEHAHEHDHSYGHHPKHRGLGTGLALSGAAVAGAAVLGGAALAARKARGRGRGRGAAAAGCAPWGRGGAAAAPRGRGRPQSFSGQGGARPPLQHSATAPVGMMHGGGFRGRGVPRGRGRGRGRGVPLAHQHSFPVNAATRGRGAVRARGMAYGAHPGAGRGVPSPTNPVVYGQGTLPTALGQPPVLCPQQVPGFNGITPQSTGYVANGFQETLGAPPPYTPAVSNVSVPAPKPVANPAQLDQMSKRKLAALQQIQRREKDRIEAKRREEEADRKRLEVAQGVEKPSQELVEPKVQINLPPGVKPVSPPVDIKPPDAINPPQELPPNVSQNGIGRSNSVLAPQVLETPPPVSYTNPHPPAPIPVAAPVRTHAPVPGNLVEMDGDQFVKPPVPLNSPAPVSYPQSPLANTSYGNAPNQPGSNRWSAVELGNCQYNPSQTQQQPTSQGPHRTLSVLQRLPSRKPIQQQRPVSMMIPPSHVQNMMNHGFNQKPSKNQNSFHYPHEHDRDREQVQNQAPPQIYPHNAPREPRKEKQKGEEVEEEGWKPPPLKIIQRRKFNSGEPDLPPQVEKASENTSPKSLAPHETSALIPPPPPPLPFDEAPPPPVLSGGNTQQAQPLVKPIENAQQTPSLSLPVRNSLQTKASNENVQPANVPSLPPENVQQTHLPSRPTETTQLPQKTTGAIENLNAHSLPPKASAEHHELVETPNSKGETPKGYFENFAPGVNIPGLTVRKGSPPASLPSRAHQGTTHLPHHQFQNQQTGYHGTIMNQTAHHSTYTNTAVDAPHFSHETSTLTVHKQFNNFPSPQGRQNMSGNLYNNPIPPQQPSIQHPNTFPTVANSNPARSIHDNDFNNYPRPPVAPQPFNNNLHNISHPPSHIMEMPGSTGFAPTGGVKSPYDMNPMIAELPEIPTAMQGAQRVDDAEYLNRSEGISYETNNKKEDEKKQEAEDEIKMSANSWGFGWDRF
ncbi:uncharacterized protein DFL_001481 [Arthrobotrys flagrans]|uniref:Uncharacterized protein n=1 Tax=Arthrobotrys flagrans TaxID=97331 RepID=A0A437A7S2_ARTFL|nr:hypothetical protein DFL_001481 [Arthrobotrys flagrans]